jgi:hypothetical protein
MVDPDMAITVSIIGRGTNHWERGGEWKVSFA